MCDVLRIGQGMGVRVGQGCRVGQGWEVLRWE